MPTTFHLPYNILVYSGHMSDVSVVKRTKSRTRKLKMAHTKLTSVLILLGSCVVNTAAQHDLHINRVRSKISGVHRPRVEHDHVMNHMNVLLDAKLGATSGSAASSTHFYNDALLDHFNSGFAPTKWSQRYYVDTTFWGGEGYPVFLYIGGEGPQSAPSDRLFMWTLAEKHSALMVSLEHRYYGESQPVPDMSVENLKYLTSEQALEDAARFIAYFSAYNNVDSSASGASGTLSSPPLVLPASPGRSPCISFGGSYPGNLASWLKLKYPSLVAGTVGSSAPVFAEYDFIQYAEVTGHALAYEPIGGSAACSEIVSEAFTSLNALVLGTAPTWGTDDAIPQALRPCNAMANELDLSTYEAELFGLFQGTVQYNNMAMKPFVSDVCSSLEASVASGATALNAFSAAMPLWGYNASLPFEDQCVASSFQDDYVAYVGNETFSSPNCNLSCASSRQWIYQSCNEFGYFQTTVAPNVNASSNPFSAFSAVNIANAGTAVCEAVFGLSQGSYDGPDSDSRGPVANTHYGGRSIEGINITMPNGNMDPWHALSVVNASDPFYQAGTGEGSKQEASASVDWVTIDGTAHCRDMWAPNVFEATGNPDTEAIQWAHAAIAANVKAYLGA